MTRGLYRTELGSVMVEDDNDQAPLSGEKYVTAGYLPSYEALPSREQYISARLKADMAAMDAEIRKLRATLRPQESGRGMWKLFKLA